MKVYLSGGVTGVPDYKDRFKKAENKLISLGYEVINPADLDFIMPDSTNYTEFISICIKLIDQADAIYMLDEWDLSRGARFERHYAEIMNMPIMEGKINGC